MFTRLDFHRKTAMSCCHNLRDPEPLDVLHISRGVSRRAMLKAVAAGFGLAAVGGLSPVSAQQGKRIKLAFCSQLLCVVPYEATRAAGFFAEEGLDVELVYTRGGGAAIQALNGGAVDYAATSLDAAINGFAKGADIVRFATTGRLPLFALATAPGKAQEIKTVEDLRGKTVGVSALANADHALVLFLLEQAGVPESEVRFATLGTNLYHALRLGQVEAGMVQEPALSLLEEQGARVIFNGMDFEHARQHLGGAYEFMGVAVRQGEVEQRREEMQRLAAALKKGLAYVQKAPVEELVDALPKELIAGGDRKALARTLERYRASLYPTSVKIDVSAVERVMDAHLKAGIQKKPVDFDRFLNTSIVKG